MWYYYFYLSNWSIWMKSCFSVGYSLPSRGRLWESNVMTFHLRRSRVISLAPATDCYGRLCPACDKLVNPEELTTVSSVSAQVWVYKVTDGRSPAAEQRAERILFLLFFFFFSHGVAVNVTAEEDCHVEVRLKNEQSAHSHRSDRRLHSPAGKWTRGSRIYLWRWFQGSEGRGSVEGSWIC